MKESRQTGAGAQPQQGPRTDPLDRLESATERAMGAAMGRVATRLNLRSLTSARFLFPLLMLLAGAVAVSIITIHELAATWIFVAVYAAPVGNELAITGALAAGLSPTLIIAIVVWIDIWGPLFLVWNLDLLMRVPRIGPFLARIEAKMAARWERHRIWRDLGVLGLVAFVWIPGSGPTPGSIVGRLAGFPWPLVWLAVSFGSIVRVVVYTLAAAEVIRWIF